MKISAADPPSSSTRGARVVFEDIHDLAARVDDPDLDCDETSVMVLRNAGPGRRPGHARVGAPADSGEAPEARCRRSVRISDARMSGTSYGAVVLHVAPESAVGGPLALVQDGDAIRLDIASRRSTSSSTRPSSQRARDAWTPPPRKDERGYRRLHAGPRAPGEPGLRPRLPARTSPVIADAVTYL